jgi:hypothetical protein
MARGRVVFVVGHANWGKSRTLRALTSGNPHQRRVQIGGVEFFIRRMSNDDRPNDFYEFIRDVQPSEKSDLIIAFCPAFEEPRTRWCLEQLQVKEYRLFFWVLHQQYGNGRFVTPDETRRLRGYGVVDIFDDGQAEDRRRATSLRIFVENVVLA